MTTLYAVLGITPYYGPSETVRLLGLYGTRPEAERVAAAHNPDYDESVGCARLGAYQSGPTFGVVAPVVRGARDVSVQDDWGWAPWEAERDAMEDFQAIQEKLGRHIALERGGEIIEQALLKHGMIEVQCDDGAYVIVQRHETNHDAWIESPR